MDVFFNQNKTNITKHTLAWTDIQIQPASFGHSFYKEDIHINWGEISYRKFK